MKTKYLVGLIACDIVTAMLLLIGIMLSYRENTLLFPYTIPLLVFMLWYFNGGISTWKELFKRFNKALREFNND